MRRAIVWFRNDLRIHDNEALVEASQLADEVLPVFVFDTRTFEGQTSFGFPKSNKFRTKFTLESVIDLSENLKKRYGVDLVIRIGKPEEEIFELAKEIKSSWVFCNRERTQEEVDVQDALEKRLWTIGQEIRYSRGKMLFYTSDLPFPVTHTPDTFTQFKKEVEKIVPIREPLLAPAKLIAIPEIDTGTMPTLDDFGWQNFDIDKRTSFPFKGGETAALEHLDKYIWEDQLLATYKQTRNDLHGVKYSSKFSAWLGVGCISPKKIYAEVKAFEREVKKNQSTYWLVFELLWRDFFRLMGKKHGNKIFQINGINDQIYPHKNTDKNLFELWANGETGNPFVDANMRELNATGFMSNRGRQNVASYLVNDLELNWIMGAEYFESLLVDYDPCSNYGNWNYLAGVGSDPRPNRHFNTMSQARRYDPDASYAKMWLPELKGLDVSEIYTEDNSTLQPG